MAINKIKSGSIEDNAITSAKVADGVISAADVADGTITEAKLEDGAITEAKLGSNAVTNAKITDGTIANAKLSNSSITLNGSAVSLGGSATITEGITEADMWRLTAAFTGDGVLTSNLERVDTVFDKIGTGVSESSGIFSFPTTGIYLIKFNASIVLGSGNSSLYTSILIDVTTNNSTYNARAEGLQQSASLGGDHWSHVYAEMIFDVTDITTHKVRFRLNAENNSSQTYGSTDNNVTSFTFIRLGDT